MNFILALLSAILLILCFPRFDVIWLAPIALSPILVALAREPNLWRRFLLGYVAGVVYWFGVCYWIQFVMFFHGGLSQIASWAVFALFCLAKALHFGVFASLAGILIRKAWAVVAVAAAWVTVEATHGPLGFAWLALGNAGISMGVPMRLAPYTGVYGLSFVFAMMAAALALAILRRPRRHWLWLAALPLLFLLPPLPPAQPGQESAILVQPNISESEEWTQESVDRMQRRLAFLSMQASLQARGQRPSLVVWPEVPAPLYENDPRLTQQVRDLARAVRAYLLVGVVSHTAEGDPLNSALLVSPTGATVSRYDKVNLVPFGEFVPWPFGFANKVSKEIGDFRPGKRVVVSPVGSQDIGVFICYESVFPGFVRRFVNNGAEVLFNLSNDGWFGKTAAREQHLRIVRMRAAENRRWILRSTNDGITATIDPAGRVLGTLPLYLEAASHTGYSYISSKTIYTRYGDWFTVVCGSITLACLITSTREATLRKSLQTRQVLA